MAWIICILEDHQLCIVIWRFEYYVLVLSWNILVNEILSKLASHTIYLLMKVGKSKFVTLACQESLRQIHRWTQWRWVFFYVYDEWLLKFGFNFKFQKKNALKFFSFLKKKNIYQIKYQIKSSKACGTPCWTAPEVLRSQNYNLKADVYSYGIVMWEVRTWNVLYLLLSLRLK